MKKAYSYIRFSTKEQEKGDSYRRQIERAKKWAKDKGVELDSTYTDKYLSAYSGDHRTKGNLGIFLGLVEQGTIERGSYLLIEDLDRLSREPITTALPQFMLLVNSGIIIVILQNENFEYTAETINDNVGLLFKPILDMGLAHGESKKKSIRLIETYDNKRKDVLDGKIKFSSKTPGWLEVTKSRKNGKYLIVEEFGIIKGYHLLIRKMFQWKLDGCGEQKIANELNKLGPRPQSKKDKNEKKAFKKWVKPTISKWLRSKAIIGEFQLHSKGVPVGDPDKNYFPSVLVGEDKGLFYDVQELIERNSKQPGNAGGQTGIVSNLFQGIVKCGLCGEAIWHRNYGPTLKGGKKLVCSTKIQKLPGRECKGKPVPYDEFEKLFFNRVKKLDISEISPGQDEIDNELLKVRLGLSESRGLVKEYDKLMERMLTAQDLTSDEGSMKDFVKKYEDTKKKRFTQNQVSLRLVASVKNLKSESDELRKNLDQTTEIYELLESIKDDKERIRIRRKLQVKISQLMVRIRIYPLQEKYKPSQATDEPGVEKIMKSKYINRVQLEFNVSGIEKQTLADRYGIINLVIHRELYDPTWDMTEEEYNNYVKKRNEISRRVNRGIAKHLNKRKRQIKRSSTS